MKRSTIKAILAIAISILATGVAGAADLTCPLVAEQAPQTFVSDLKRPDLLGSTFRVERMSFTHAKAGPNTSWQIVDVMVLQVTNGRERFLILRTTSTGGLSYTGSFDPTELRDHQTRWWADDSRAMISPATDLSDPIYSGPLQHMVLRPSCN